MSSAGWLRSFRDADDERGAAPVLVCFPCAGGTASAYRLWPRSLPASVGVIAVQYPGRQDRLAEPPLHSIQDIADRVAECLLAAAAPAARLTLFGHSMGASVAHEVASRLQAAGRPVRGLMVSGRRPPHLLAEGADREWSDDDLVADVARLGGTGAAVLAQPDLRELVLPAIRADYTAVRRYRPQRFRSLHCPVVGYAGDQDPQVTAAELGQWCTLTVGRFDPVLLPGGHFYLEHQPDRLLADIGRRLLAGATG